jgi:hypothetical protein
MRMRERSIIRDQIFSVVDTFEFIESNPDDKYLPATLFMAKPLLLSSMSCLESIVPIVIFVLLPPTIQIRLSGWAISKGENHEMSCMQH